MREVTGNIQNFRMPGLSDRHAGDEREEYQPMKKVSIPLSAFLLTCAASQLVCLQAYAADPAREKGSATARKAAGIRAASKQKAASLPKEDETVIVTGTRDPHQTVRKSASPIQVVTSAEISRTGQSDLRDALTQLTPSLTRAPLLIGNANMVDVLRLRGLSPNHTLILVDGKRRHATSVLSNNSGPQQGSNGVDIDMIPISAIDHVEILQDGAAALYGSDAVAGVINIILKHRKSGITMQATNGGRYAGDGFQSGESINAGFDLMGRGFFDLSAEYKYQDHTIRNSADSRNGKYDFKDEGDPRQQRGTISYNMQYDFLPDLSLYSFSTYGHRYGESYQDARVASSEWPMYPNGFSPKESVSEDDYSVTLGLKGEKFGWNWDLSTTYGSDHTSMDLFNTVNPSLYAATGASPTSFHEMAFTNTQWTNDFGIHRSFHTPIFAGPINLAMGAQYRYDEFDIMSGDANSYYGTGPQGLHGLSPQNASESNRDVTAGYVELSMRPLKNWQVDFAGRYEYYTDAGDTKTGKVSTRYDFNKYFALRGTISNGFSAPSLLQEHWSNLSVAPTYATGYLPVNSAGARLIGAKPLHPEHTMSYSAGFTLDPLPRLHISVDAYQITIKNRILAAGVYNGANAIEALRLDGFTVPSTLQSNAVTASYYANAADTRTRGLDVTARYETRFRDWGKIDWDVALNLNETDLTHTGKDANGNSLLNSQQAAYITSYTPKNKLIFGGTWQYKKLGVSVHEVRYGHATSSLTYYEGPLAYSNTDFMRYVNKARFETNLAVSYQVLPQLGLTLGGNNVGNAKQRRIPKEFRYLGAFQYDYQIEQLGYNGGYYYLQANLNF